MRLPPWLLGATLLFWGWQTGFVIAGVIMAAAVEGPRLVKARWEFSDEDLARIATFCTVAALAMALYAFTSREGPASFGGMFSDPNPYHANRLSLSAQKTATAILQWLPMALFLFVAAQVYSGREGVPVSTTSLLLRRRRRKALQAGRVPPPDHIVDATFPYFLVCLFAASAHSGGNTAFYWGACLLVGWALWPQRSKRFGTAVWAGVFGLTMLGGYAGQRGIIGLQRAMENYNPQWLVGGGRHGFDPSQSRTEIGEIGAIKTSGTIVIRLSTSEGQPAPEHLMEASYRLYRGTAWNVGGAKDFGDISPEADGTTWVLQPGATNAAEVNIACYLDGGTALLPLPTGCRKLEHVPQYTLIRTNGVRAVMAEGPGLMIFDAQQGDGTLTNSPPGPEDRDVPDRENAALEQVISELPVADKSREEKLQAVSEFFQSKFRYSLWQRPSGRGSTNETPLGRFLLRTRNGHCEYFATATVLLLRKLGIEARYAVGYAVHERSGKGYVVRERDAHAWCLAWNGDRKVWEQFDTTPPSWMAEEGKRASVWQFISDGWSWLWFEFSRFRWSQTNLRQYILWGLVPVLGFLFYQIVFRRRRRKNAATRAGGSAVRWAGWDSEFYLLEKELAKRGFARDSNEPLAPWLRRIMAQPVLAEAGGALSELLRLHYRHRFDPEGLSATERESLRAQAEACLARLKTRALS